MKGYLKAGFIAAALIILAALSVMQPVSGANINATSDAIVYVTINRVTMIDINPQYLQWGYVTPGHNYFLYNATNQSGKGLLAENLEGIVVENIGSTNITRVWFNNTYPTSRPFGTGNVLNYDPANWILFKINNTNRSDATGDMNKYRYINRVEYNESARLLYLQDDGLANPHQGRLRVGNYEYYFAYDGDNQTDQMTFRIGIRPHNETMTGDIDLGNGCENGEVPDDAPGGASCVEVELQRATGSVFIGNLSVTGGSFGASPDSTGEPYWNETCVRVELGAGDNGEDRIIFFKWNPELDTAGGPNGGLCMWDKYPWDEVDLGHNFMYPGDILTINTQLAVPYGVAFSTDGTPDGQTQISGTIYVMAETQ